MITTVSLNPSLDKSVSIKEFNYGSMNRVVSSRVDAGGKAINLSYVASLLGLEVTCVGFVRENGRDIIEKRLSDAGVKTEFITLAGSIRTNTKLLDISKGVVTEINEPGAPVGEKNLNDMRDMILDYSAKSDFLVLTGSVPSDCPKSFYADIIKNSKCKCVLDAEGESLNLGVAQRPFLIKPNKMEVEMLAGKKLSGLAEIRDAAASVCQRGVSIMAVSLGSEGALMTNGIDTYFAPSVKVEVKSTVGAGDSMVAGFLSGLAQGEELKEVLRRGVACASAGITHSGTQLMDIDTYGDMLKRIKIERM